MNTHSMFGRYFRRLGSLVAVRSVRTEDQKRQVFAVGPADAAITRIRNEVLALEHILFKNKPAE